MPWECLIPSLMFHMFWWSLFFHVFDVFLQTVLTSKLEATVNTLTLAWQKRGSDFPQKEEVMDWASDGMLELQFPHVGTV